MRELTPAEQRLVECVLDARRHHLERFDAGRPADRPAGRLTSRKARKKVLKTAFEAYYRWADAALLQSEDLALNFWCVAHQLASAHGQAILARALLVRGKWHLPAASCEALCEAFGCTTKLRRIGTRQDTFSALAMAQTLALTAPNTRRAFWLLYQLLQAASAPHVKCIRWCAANLDCEPCRDQALEFQRCSLHDFTRFTMVLREYINRARLHVNSSLARYLAGAAHAFKYADSTSPCVLALYSLVAAAVAEARLHDPPRLVAFDSQLLYPSFIGKIALSELRPDRTNCRYSALVGRMEDAIDVSDRLVRANAYWYITTFNVVDDLWPKSLINQAMAQVLPRRTLSYRGVQLARHCVRLIERLQELGGAADTGVQFVAAALHKTQEALRDRHMAGVSSRSNAAAFSVARAFKRRYSQLGTASIYAEICRAITSRLLMTGQPRRAATIETWRHAADAWRMYSALETEECREKERREATEQMIVTIIDQAQWRHPPGWGLFDDIKAFIHPSILSAADLQRIRAGF